MGSVRIRTATSEDWPGIWRFMAGIVAAGETFCWDTDTTAEQARRYWLHTTPPGRTLVAEEESGALLGTAELHPNHAGGGAHVANAGFMVDPAVSGRGIGRALGEHVLASARADGYAAMQFNAVVETNTGAVALWRSLGFTVLTTVPRAFRHPHDGEVGLHVMYRRLDD